MDAIVNFLQQTGFYLVQENPLSLVMLAVSCVLLFLAIVKKFEPLLLLPIAFGMLLTNLPGAGMYHEVLFANGEVQWALFGGQPVSQAIIDDIAAGGATDVILNELNALMGQSISVGLLDVLYLGVKLGVYPCLIFVGVGAMTDFGPLIANPKSLLLGAAAQLGIFITYCGAVLLGFTGAEASSIGIIGGADGPTAIFTTSHLAPHLLGPIAVAAYSYMALVPIVQPPIIRMCTTRKERRIRMTYTGKKVSKRAKILFPIVVTVIVGLVAPDAVSLIGFLMFGNLLRECGVLNSLAETAQKVLANLITIFLGLTISARMTAAEFLQPETLLIMCLGLVAFVVDTFGGIMLAKLMNLFTKKKINPMIGAAGISAFPMSARVVHKIGLEEDNQNFLLMHAVGVNVSGQIASVIAGGLILALVAG